MALLDYRYCSSVGDIVMIHGSVLGIVTEKEIIESGHVMHIKVFPFTNFPYRLYLLVTGRLDFYEGQIDNSSVINPVHMLQGRVYQM